MKFSLILLLAGASVSVQRGPAQAPLAPAPLHIQMPTPEGGARGDPKLTGKARLPGFAPELADMPRISSPKGWGGQTMRQALAGLAGSRQNTRQSARWVYAKTLISQDRHAEALGVLDVMLQDDPDLALVANYELARGVVLAALARPEEALSALDRDELVGNTEACFWRARAFAQSGLNDDALREFGCARAALAARTGPQRVPFLSEMAEAALAKQQPELALRWLAAAPDGDATANIMRGRAHVAMSDYGKARIRLGRAERSGDEAERYQARLALIELGVAQRTMGLKEARREVDRIRFVWRGGPIEEQALRLSYSLAKKAGDARGSIAAGATLIRYFELGSELPPLVADVQSRLAALLAPGNKMPLSEAAGIYWDYRDLMPAGGEGDRLVAQLADRLQASGLYARAAELLEHQLRHRALDIAQGPLSVRVATLHVLAGRPDRALAAIRDTEGTIFPQQMLWDRNRIMAVALHQLGKTEAALSVLDDVPDASGLRTELLWKRRDWGRLVAESAASLPPADSLNEVRQAVVLRHAIALGMLGREEELARLRTRYQAGFSGLPTAPAFDLLTKDAAGVEAESLSRAMSAIPSASPAGIYADLLDVAPAPLKSK
ncbi:tetratricopeptide repeat protein [Novosphingobium sp. M1R2S20]|uniref:Tetratricopeptide repeat protein n=1 Tax=Novosphingobium rhizovicinum TaxID=3228928 RepID=A0ABV3R8S2_9SPHN